MQVDPLREGRQFEQLVGASDGPCPDRCRSLRRSIQLSFLFGATVLAIGVAGIPTPAFPQGPPDDREVRGEVRRCSPLPWIRGRHQRAYRGRPLGSELEEVGLGVPRRRGAQKGQTFLPRGSVQRPVPAEGTPQRGLGELRFHRRRLWHQSQPSQNQGWSCLSRG